MAEGGGPWSYRSLPDGHPVWFPFDGIQDPQDVKAREALRDRQAQVLISQMENQGPERGSELPKVTQHMSQQFMSLYIHLVQAYRSTSWGEMPEVFWHRLDMDAAIWGAVLCGWGSVFRISWLFLPPALPHPTGCSREISKMRTLSSIMQPLLSLSGVRRSGCK